MSERNERRTVAFIDLEALRGGLEAAGVAPIAFAERLTRFLRGLGRLTSATVYGALSVEDVRELRRLGVEGRPTLEDGEGSAPESIVLALDAAELLASAPPPDVVLVATDDAQLAELVRRWRKKGAYVVALVPEALLEAEPAKSADRAVTAAQVLADQVGVELRAPAERRATEVRPAEPRPRPPAAPAELEGVDWTKLVVLLRDLEAKMPFVGMKWLKNKVLGPQNVGMSGMPEKQALLNRAVAEGLVETFQVGNRAEQGDPVTACRLVRDHAMVKQILAANPGPPPVSQRPATDAP